MSWTVPVAWVNGTVVTDSMMNTYVANDIQYLKDVFDGVQLQTWVQGNNQGILFKDSGGVARLGIIASGANDLWFQMLNGSQLLKVVNFGGTQELFHIDSTGDVQVWDKRIVFKNAGVADARAHRHYNADDRHVESGQSSLAAGASHTFTFARPFTASPDIGVSCGNDSPAVITAISASAVTIKNNSGSTQIVSFVASGVSS